MNKFIFLLLLVFFALSNTHAQTEEAHIALLKKAKNAFNSRNIKEAISLSEEAVDLLKSEKPIKQKELIAASNHLNFYYILAADYKKASTSCAATYQSAKRLYENGNLPKQSFIQSMNNLSRYYRNTGNYIMAKKIVEKTLSIYDKERYPKDYGSELNNLAELYRIAGNHKKAKLLYEESLRLCEDNNCDPLTRCILHSNIGLLYFELGIFDKANEFYKKASDIIPKIANEYYRNLLKFKIQNNLAYTYAEYDYKKAENSLLQNYENSKNNVRRNMLACHSLSKLYGRYGEFEKSEKFAEEVRKICLNHFSKKHILYYSSIKASADNAARNKQYKKAEKLYKEAISVAKKHHSGEIKYLNEAYFELSKIYLKKNRLEKALLYSDKIFNTLPEEILSNFTVLSEKEKYQNLKNYKKYFEIYQNIVSNYSETKPEATKKLYRLFVFKKKLIMMNTRLINRLVSETDKDELNELFRLLSETKRQIAKHKMYRINRDTLKLLKIQAEKTEKKIINKLNEKYPDLRLMPKTLKYEDVKTSLKKGQAVVDYISFRKFGKNGYTDTVIYYALAFTKNDKYPKLIKLGYEHDLMSILQNKGLSAAEYITRIYQAKQNKLSEFVWSKIEKKLTGVKELKISPSGLLNNISFHALACKNGTRLKDKYDIRLYTNSANIINEKPFIISKNKNAQIFGNPAYQLPNDESEDKKKPSTSALISPELANSEDLLKVHIDPLPETETEIKSTVEQLRKNKLTVNYFLETQANEENFYRACKQKPNILHIATHGFYIRKDKNLKADMFNKSVIDNSMLNSGLLLAGAQNSLTNKNVPELNEDGILSAYEISLQPLHQTELVVLSACQTALGDLYTDEGIAGLKRAFKISGSKYLILSLWDVPSRQTVEFMNHFYEHLCKAHPAHIAFESALDKMSAKYKSPYFWAGFILVN